MQLDSDRKPRRLISLTPLIDVVFILLVFFMISSNFVEWRKIPLQSGQSGNSTSSQGTALLIRVTDDHLYIEDTAFDSIALNSLLTEKMDENPDLKILIKPEQAVKLQRLVSVMDDLQTSAINQVTIVK